jgi:hypothetical protein
MTQRQITNHKSDNLLIRIGSTRVLPEIILKFQNIGEVGNKIIKTQTSHDGSQDRISLGPNSFLEW